MPVPKKDGNLLNELYIYIYTLTNDIVFNKKKKYVQIYIYTL